MFLTQKIRLDEIMLKIDHKFHFKSLMERKDEIIIVSILF